MMPTLLAALALQAAAPAPPADPLAGDWLPVHEQAEFRLEVDEGATRRDGDLVQVRLRMDLREDQSDGGRWGIIRMELNCRSRMGRQLSVHVHGADGRLVGDSGRAAQEPRAPTTAQGRQFLEATCHRTGWGEDGAAE
jgi:hypothetical protein